MLACWHPKSSYLQLQNGQSEPVITVAEPESVAKRASLMDQQHIFWRRLSIGQQRKTTGKGIGRPAVFELSF